MAVRYIDGLEQACSISIAFKIAVSITQSTLVQLQRLSCNLQYIKSLYNAPYMFEQRFNNQLIFWVNDNCGSIGGRIGKFYCFGNGQRIYMIKLFSGDVHLILQMS